MRASGTLLCLASAAAFGAMGIFGKLAYAQGVTVGTLLSVRFLLAAALFWALLLATGAAGAVRALPRRDLAIAIALGALGYAAQAGAYFAALSRIDASVLALLVYTYPAIVTAAAIALGREPGSARRLTALALTSIGLVLILAGGISGRLDALGAGLGIAAAVVYSAYILVSDRVTARVAPVVLSALVCAGAAGTLTAGAALAGELHPERVTLAGWGWLVGLAAISTVGAIGLFFAALRRLGPSSAAIVSTAEPLTTVLLALAVFGETLGPAEIAGGAVLAAGVLVLQVRSRTAVLRDP